VAVVVNGSGHWFPLALLALCGVRVVPSLHCVLWPRSRRPAGVNRLVARLDALLFGRSAFALLSASRDITRQVAELPRGRPRPGVGSLPTSRPGTFTPVPPPEPRRPFRVFFAGRVEQNKGVFDLLAIARRFAADGRTDVEFDLCGDGTALPELRKQA